MLELMASGTAQCKEAADGVAGSAGAARAWRGAAPGRAQHPVGSRVSRSTRRRAVLFVEDRLPSFCGL